MKTIPVFFINPSNYDDPSAPLGFTKILNVNTTYEEILALLVQKHYLFPPSPPSPDIISTYFSVFVAAYNRLTAKRRELGKAWAVLRDGMTLASVDIITTETEFLVCLGRKIQYKRGDRVPAPSVIALHHVVYNNDVAELVDREVAASGPKQRPSSAAANLDEKINAVLTSTEVGIVNLAASAVTITTALIIIAKSWSTTHQARKAHKTDSPPHYPQSGKTDIYAIRVRMTDGRERTMQQWLSEPEDLKRFIDVFLQPSSQMTPIEVVFVLWNRDTIVVDVSEGTQGNLQLDEMLKYLKNAPPEK